MERVAVYPGSFDPVTIGHMDIIERAAKQFDKLLVCVLPNQGKNPLFSTEERILMLQRVTAAMPNVTVCAYQGLLMDFVREQEATAVVRGLRAVTDFEYEVQLAQANYKLYDKADTVFFVASPEYSYISSSAAREVAQFGGDVSLFVPEQIVEELYHKCRGAG